MRTRYNRILTRSALIACLSFVAVTGLPKVIDWISPEQTRSITVVEFKSPDPVDLLLPPKVMEEEFEPPELPAPIKKVGARPAPRTIEFRVIEPSDAELSSPLASKISDQSRFGSPSPLTSNCLVNNPLKFRSLRIGKKDFFRAVHFTFSPNFELRSLKIGNLLSSR